MSQSQESILSCSKRGSLKKYADKAGKTPKLRAKKRSFLEDSLTPSFFQRDTAISKENNNNETTSQLFYDEEHLFSETQAESDTFLLDKIVVGKINNKTKKISKCKKSKKQYSQSQNKSVKSKQKTTNFNIMRFQENTKNLRKKTYRFYCFEEKDLTIDEQFKNKDIPQHQSDNDKQSDDDTINHAIKQCTQSLWEAIENEKKEFEQKQNSTFDIKDCNDSDFDLDEDNLNIKQKIMSYSSFDLASETEQEEIKYSNQKQQILQQNNVQFKRKLSSSESDAFMQQIFSSSSSGSSDSSSCSSDSEDFNLTQSPNMSQMSRKSKRIQKNNIKQQQQKQTEKQQKKMSIQKNKSINKKNNKYSSAKKGNINANEKQKNNLLSSVLKRSSCRSLRSSQLSM